MLMNEIRLAQKGETVRQKDIWKLCFGDSDGYIDFYYANRYKEDETVVLLHDGEIRAMLTMIPVKTVLPDQRSLDTVMLYAIATHPQYQHKGLATQLMNFVNQYLNTAKTELSVLVPAKVQLFDYYLKHGYRNGFYIRETQLFLDRVDSRPFNKLYECTIYPVAPKEYNRRRNNQLYGRLYISYADEDIAYQKKLSQQSGTDIYAVDIEGIEGCLTVERMSSDKVQIKEFLLPEDFINTAITQIVQQVSAKEYILRTPAYIGKQLGGIVRPFGMIRSPSEIDLVTTPENSGYLGFAFD